jgi:hypothetical protein
VELGPGHVDEWTLSLAGERHLAPSTIRGYQTDLRLFSEYLTDGRYGWAAACEKAFGPGRHPVAICHEWNTIAHLNEYEGSPEARPFTREELQAFLDYADEQVDRAVAAKRKGALAAYRDATLVQGHLRVGAAAHRDVEAGRGGLGPQPGGAGVRPVRDAARALRQGGARAAAAAAERPVGDGLGGGGGGRLRGEHPAQVRVPGSSGFVGDRAGRAGQAGRDQRPVHRLPRRAGPARRPGPAQPAAFAGHAPD